jgi:O-antigen/teichoic acid export membrane protein
MLAALLLPIAAVVAAFATDLLRLWTANAPLAAASGPILTLLVIGTALNGLLNLPYALQLAYGWTRLGLWVNMVSVPCVVPAIWVMGSNFGGIGAAAVWLVLNVGYLLFSIPLMHRRLLTRDMWRWYLADIGPPLVVSALVAMSWRLAVSSVPDGFLGWLSLFVVLATAMTASLAVSSFPRNTVHAWLTAVRGPVK